MQHTVQTLLAQGKSERAISRELGIHRDVVRRLKKEAREGLPPKRYQRDKKLDSYQEQLRAWVEKGLTGQLIFQKLREQFQVDVSYPTVLRQIRDLKQLETFVPLLCEPGEEAQVDFGYLGRFELEDGSFIKVWGFCMVLSFSRYAYYEIVTDQSVATFIRCHIHAFEYFGGVPRWIRLDNLKAGVLQADFFEPLLQEQYAEFLSYYGGAAHPCRVYKPEHKGKVESGIKYLKHNFVRGLEHRQFSRLAGELRQWNEAVCNRRRHGTTHRVPREVWEQTEKNCLLPLPADRYEIYRLEERKVDRMGHVTFLNNYYSAPYTLVGQLLQLRSNGCLLRIFHQRQEVAVHQLAQGKGQYVTREEHKPPHKQHRGRAYYAERLQQIGSAAGQLLEAFIQQDIGHWKEKVQGILHLKRIYSPTLLEQACQQALEHQLYSYQAVKSICLRLKYPDPLPPEGLPPNLGGYHHDLSRYDQLVHPSTTIPS